MPMLSQKEIERTSDTANSFRLLADTIPTLCWMAEADGTIYWYNKRWYEYTGTTPEEMEIRGWKSVHDPKDLPALMERWKKALKTGDPFDMVVSLRDADGKSHPFLSHIVPMKNEAGKVTGWLGIKNDISELQAANTALKASEEKFKTLAEAMPQMAFIAGRDGEITYYNQRWYEYVNGMEGTEGWGWKDKDILHPDDLQRTIDRWTASLQTGEDYEIEYRIRRFDDRYRWHLGRAVAVHDKTGEISYWIGTNTDIHEQKRQEQTQAFLLQAAKELASSLDYKKTLETITKLCVPEVADWCSVELLNDNGEFEQVAIAHIDPSKVEMAKEFRARNPVRAEDPTGVPEVVRTCKAEFYPYIDNALLEAVVDDPVTLQLLKDLHLRSSITAPISVKGEPKGAITFISSESGTYYTEADLQMAEELASRISLAMTNSVVYTEAKAELKRRKQLERQLIREKETLEDRVARRTSQLNALNAELTRSNQELQDFAYVASHDLQEPLRKIQAFGDILESEFSDRLEEGAEYLKRMHAAASRMSQLIEDLLVFSRVTTRPPTPTKIDLSKVVGEVLIDLEARITETDGRVEVGDLPEVMADPTHMRQLFQNLIGNALKFHRDGVLPIVKVSAQPSKDVHGTCEITVADNGIGFDEKYGDRIFGVFQRLHGRDSYDGTGIGLAVCRKIVERYNGTITAQGQPGEGATFIIKLPAATKETKGDK